MARKKERNYVAEFMALSDADRERVVAEFDKEMIIDTFRQPTPAERKIWLRARRKAGRPRIGKGAKIISLTVERDLLRQADARAKSEGVSRAQLFARGLRTLLASA